MSQKSNENRMWLSKHQSTFSMSLVSQRDGWCLCCCRATASWGFWNDMKRYSSSLAPDKKGGVTWGTGRSLTANALLRPSRHRDDNRDLERCWRGLETVWIIWTLMECWCHHAEENQRLHAHDHRGPSLKSHTVTHTPLLQPKLYWLRIVQQIP